MHTHSVRPNLEYLEKPSGGAFVVQEHARDTPSFSDLLDLQRSIAIGEFDFDRAVHLIARCARNVANASGIAIALLERNQLVYRAGCGSAASYVGRRVMATLSVSGYDRGEILRVEDAQTDTRIEAAICRQFGAKSLLILPIYHNGTVAGALQIFFAEVHAFGYREMATYRVIAGLVEEAIWYADEVEHEKTPAAVSIISPPAEPLRLYGRGWQAALAAILALASWIAYSGRRPALSAAFSASASSSAIALGAPFASAKPHPADTMSRLQTGRAEDGRKAARTLPRWVWVGENELDYLAQGVKVRYFIPRPQPQQMSLAKSHVKYIGEDVTVRYFTPEQATALPPLPTGSAARPAAGCTAGGLCPGGREIRVPNLNN
ncbi:MAG TPA: GAF domain-containing protein [Terriglobales bacterium]|nr:GAF domain-containing protein [Terriglobales bacterium]